MRARWLAALSLLFAVAFISLGAVLEAPRQAGVAVREHDRATAARELGEFDVDELHLVPPLLSTLRRYCHDQRGG